MGEILALVYRSSKKSRCLLLRRHTSVTLVAPQASGLSQSFLGLFLFYLQRFLCGWAGFLHGPAIFATGSLQALEAFLLFLMHPVCWPCLSPRLPLVVLTAFILLSLCVSARLRLVLPLVWLEIASSYGPGIGPHFVFSRGGSKVLSVGLVALVS